MSDVNLYISSQKSLLIHLNIFKKKTRGKGFVTLKQVNVIPPF